MIVQNSYKLAVTEHYLYYIHLEYYFSTLNEIARKQYSTWRIWPAPSTRQTLLITSNDQTSSVREARKNLHNPRRGTGNLGGDQETNSDPPLVGKIIKIRYPCS